MSATFTETDSGGWCWTWAEPGDPPITRQLEWQHQRGTWLSWQRVDGGAWTAQDLPDWEPPADREHAEQIVQGYLQRRSP